MSHDPPRSVTGSPSVSCNQGLEQASLVDGLSKINNQYHDVTGSPSVSLDAAQKSHADVSTGKSSKFKAKPFTQDLLFLENAVSENDQNENLDEKMLQTSLKTLRKSSLVSKPEGGDFGVQKSENVVADAEAACNLQQDKQVPSPPNRNSETEKSQVIANLEKLQEGNGNLITKPGRIKMIAKKTLGSRSKLKSNANQKGSIYLKKVAAQNEPVVGLPIETADHENSSFNDHATFPETVNVIAAKEAETQIGTKSRDNIENETTFLDDETEAPEDNDTSEGILDEVKAGVVDLSHKADDKMEVKPDGARHSTNNTAADRDDGAKEEKNAVQLQQKDKTICKANCMKGKLRQGKKQPPGKSKTKTVPPVSGHAKSKKFSVREETCNGKDIVETAIEEEKGKPCSAGQTKSRNVSKRKSDNSMEAEKENKPIVDGDQRISQFKGHVRKTTLKSDNVSMKIKQKSGKSNLNCTLVREVSKQVKTEPIWFILSGHKLQRKEFQQVIRRLKGKFLRDSHQWSYQATHFIAPDPIRRTEKFFAAAASGRWILKTDYLASCSQAGRFVDEEPYEWHKHGLSEDGAINLEAPRKWRLLREKTGHGAFNGMRVIIYGECIAPSLDTLKRVVKAGDGTILATSPPYTRFLTSGVDYAIISPGMPRVDLWVQEFLRHEIPCIVADYLVEYVCKPGYSLERHVLYNTHAWAEKSFPNLLSKAEEIVEDLTPSDDYSGDDIACQVCGSRNRGEVMLICGDESGSVGCGIGMHLDCCDPPLENIPEEDWFCPDCSSSNSNSSPKRRKGLN
ncbi:hypothetical protein GH714_037861 [Hevea brasiliensis]|uniref:PHD-type domain-containing protein n=1 Tax=Hevea brasiliensis TaxID=3981 RepID=A0A6A6LUV5_HEVBR|nr:hypothetical protein GH714_037861 [Hevea brasiliensis]